MKASIIIALDSSYNFTEVFLGHLCRYATLSEYELIFTDDGNDEVDYKHLLDIYIKNYYYIPHKNKHGYGIVNNHAVQHSHNDILIFMNSDIILTEKCLETLITSLHEHNAVAVQPLLIYPQTNLVQSTGHVFNKLYNAHLFENRNISDPIVQTAGIRKSLTTALCVMYKNVFLAYNGFNEFYFNAWEGMELMLKLSLNGEICFYEPKAVAYHIRGGGRGQYFIDETPQTARFWTCWGDKINENITDAYLMQLSETMLLKKYIVINFSCITNLESIFEKLPIKIIKYVNYCELAKMDKIEFFKELPYAYSTLNSCFIFFSNNFKNILNNRLWFTMRGDKQDYIMDLSGNLIKPKRLP